jgi:hypothetical protein
MNYNCLQDNRFQLPSTAVPRVPNILLCSKHVVNLSIEQIPQLRVEMSHAADGGLHQFPVAQVSGDADEHGGGEAKRNSVQQVFFLPCGLEEEKRLGWMDWAEEKCQRKLSRIGLDHATFFSVLVGPTSQFSALRPFPSWCRPAV